MIVLSVFPKDVTEIGSVYVGIELATLRFLFGALADLAMFAVDIFISYCSV